MKMFFLEKSITKIKEFYPQTFKAVYPRNIVVPGGYTDPALYGAVLFGYLNLVQNRDMTEFAHRVAYMISLSLMANRVPTYFIGDEFAQAVANTDLPGDFKFAELKWPMESQVFVLSDKFCQAYYGHYAPFLMIGRLRTGNYPKDFAKMPRCDIPLPHIGNQGDKIVLDYSHFGAESPVTYNGSYPLSAGIEIFKSAPWNDATLFENAYHHMDLTPKGELNREDEEMFVQKAQQLAVKLLLTVAEMPGLREHGKIVRHAIVTQQKTIKLPELVSANFIGRTYHIPRKYAAPVVTGPRAKPRFKYRRGHYMWAAQQFKNMEFVSVEQMPRKTDGFIDFDAAGNELAEKFRASHRRTWVEGFFFDEAEEVPTTDSK